MELQRLFYKYYVLFFWILLDCSLLLVSGRVARRQIIPEFVQHSRKEITVHKGETVVLKCAIKNLGPRVVVWRKVSEDFPLSVGTHMYAPVDEMSIDYKKTGKYKTRWDLIIKRTEPRHSGKYECQIVTKGLKTYHITLTVLPSSKPHRKGTVAKSRSTYIDEEATGAAIAITGAVFINMYQKLNLTCNATGVLRAPDAVDWFHDGHIINSSDKKYSNRLVFLNKVPEVPGRSLISTLIIERCTDADKGSYVCRSSDLDTTSITVHILSAVDKNVVRRNNQGKHHHGDSTHDDSEATDKLQRNTVRSNRSPRCVYSTSLLVVTILIGLISTIR